MGKRLLRDTVFLCAAFIVGGELIGRLFEFVEPEGGFFQEEVYEDVAAAVRGEFRALGPDQAQEYLDAAGLSDSWQVAFIEENGSVSVTTSFLVPEQGYALRAGPFSYEEPSAWTQLLAFSVVCLVAAFISLLLRSINFRRIRAIEAGARAINSGQWEVRVGPQGSDELGMLARHFDQMAEGVQARIERQQTLLHAIAHEYRTPLARIRFGLDQLLESRGQEEIARQYARVDRALDDLDVLVSEVLEFARIDAIREVSATLVPIRALVDSVIEELEDAAVAAPIQIDVEVEEVLQVVADIRHVRRVVTNLLSNGCRHARRKVRVVAQVEGSNLHLEIEDDGLGVAQEDRESVFEPFWRAGEGRSRVDGGSGLGLAIVRRTVEYYGGTVEVGTSADGGASFCVRWPLRPSHGGVPE